MFPTVLLRLDAAFLLREVFANGAKARGVFLEKGSQRILVIRAQGIRKSITGIQQGDAEVMADARFRDQGDDGSASQKQQGDATENPGNQMDVHDAGDGSGTQEDERGGGEGFDRTVAIAKFPFQILAHMEAFDIAVRRAADAFDEMLPRF